MSDNNWREPSISLLCKLGSITRHVEEIASDTGYPFDIEILKTLVGDPEIIEWISEMDDMALIPARQHLEETVAHELAKAVRVLNTARVALKNTDKKIWLNRVNTLHNELCILRDKIYKNRGITHTRGTT
jgi:hypothetical protein